MTDMLSPPNKYVKHTEQLICHAQGMPVLSERIRRCLQEQGARQVDLAEAAGTTRATVSEWLSGETKTISAKYLFPAAAFLGVTPTWLNTGRGPKYPADHDENVNLLYKPAKVSIIPWNMVIAWTQGVVHEPGELKTTAYNQGGPRTFAVEIQGESMVGRSTSFLPGELVHIDPDQTNLEPDILVLAELTGSGQPTFKQLKHEDGRYYLSPLNPHFPPIFEDFVILGRAVAKTMAL